MKKRDIPLTLAMMETMAGCTIQTKPNTKPSKKIIYPPIGQSNKKCQVCGHKNKKCTCKKESNE
jgi:hypothetical protein